MKIGLEIRFYDDGPNLVIWMNGKGISLKHEYYALDASSSDELIMAAALCSSQSPTAFTFDLEENTQCKTN